MTNARKLSKLSVEEYLLLEESADVKHEYVDGEIFAMTGGTLAHNRIAINITSALHSQMKGSGWTLPNVWFL